MNVCVFQLTNAPTDAIVGVMPASFPRRCLGANSEIYTGASNM